MSGPSYSPYRSNLEGTDITAGRKKITKKHTAGERRIWLGSVQGKLESCIFLQIARSPGCVWTSVIPDFEGVRCLSKGSRVVLLVGVYVPDDLCCCAGDYAICWADGVGVAVVADGGYGKMCGGREDVGKVPAKGDELGGCDFVVGRGGLRGLCDGDEAGGRRVGDACCGRCGHFGRRGRRRRG